MVKFILSLFIQIIKYTNDIDVKKTLLLYNKSLPIKKLKLIVAESLLRSFYAKNFNDATDKIFKKSTRLKMLNMALKAFKFILLVDYVDYFYYFYFIKIAPSSRS